MSRGRDRGMNHSNIILSEDLLLMGLKDPYTADANPSVMKVPTIKVIRLIGRLNGLWAGLILSRKGRLKSIMGIKAIKDIPNSLLGTIRRISKVGNKNHSGKISRGVAKGLAGGPMGVGSHTQVAGNPVPFPSLK